VIVRPKRAFEHADRTHIAVAIQQRVQTGHVRLSVAFTTPGWASFRLPRPLTVPEVRLNSFGWESSSVGIHTKR
jgi:hypothetical protein